MEVTYKGPYRGRRINLWYHNQHFDVIKNMKGFYGSKHCCDNYNKPCACLEDHRCIDACYICLDKSCMVDSPVRCSDCDRLADQKNVKKDTN